MKKAPVVNLEIESFVYIGSIGASHYWGTLRFGDQRHKLERILTQAQADVTNKKDRMCSHLDSWKAGDVTHRMDSEEEVVQYAKEKWKELFPDAVALLRGSHCVADPQEMIDGPPELMKKANKLWKQGEKNDGWEGDQKKMQKICDAWEALF
jgi:hypothetical protein